VVVMGRALRTRLVATVGVGVVALAALLVGGRLIGRALP
jgi:hypothetical protein